MEEIRVRTRTGVEGVILEDDFLYFGKAKVYCEDGTKLLCHPQTLTLL